MSFHHPALLWLLALPLLWGFHHWVARGKTLVLPFDHGSQKEGRWLGFLVRAAGTMPGVLLAVAVLILAGPRRPAPPADERVMNNLLLCIDVSGSMGMAFGSGGTRFEGAVASAREFCAYRKGDAFGLTVFGSEYIHWVPPTPELSALSSALDFVRPENMPPWMGGTLIANALRGCRDQLVREEEGDRAIILISDGGSADFGGGGDRAVAEELALAEIRVFSILMGDDGGGAAGLETVSSVTGGKMFTAGDPAALHEVFREIDRMQKSRFKPASAEWVDWNRPFVVAGISTLVLMALCAWGLRFNPW
ncbi:MAG: hypothetical protein RLZ97_2397 [Verrucomicrobiota bacterium]